MKTKTINQKLTIENSNPEEIYEVLMDSDKHAELIDSTAKISDFQQKVKL